MAKFVCTVCGFVYDEASGIPEAGIARAQSGKIYRKTGFVHSVVRRNQNLRNRVALLQLTRKNQNL